MNTLYSKFSRRLLAAWLGIPEPRLLVVLCCVGLAFLVGVMLGRALYHFATLGA